MTYMIADVNIICRKVSTARVDGLRDVPSPSAGVLAGGLPYKKFLGSMEHLDWLKKVLNAAKIITIEDYKLTKY